MLRMALAGIALAVLAGCGGQSGVDGFDGFKWGTTRAEIERMRGAVPATERNSPDRPFASWSGGGESLIGLPIESVTYYFRAPCNEPVTPCDLQAGSYMIAAKTQSAADHLVAGLAEKYGAFEKVSRSREPLLISSRDRSGAQDTLEYWVWNLPDSSRVSVAVGSFDKPFVDFQQNRVQEGIHMLSVVYQSPDHAAAVDRQSNFLGSDKSI